MEKIKPISEKSCRYDRKSNKVILTTHQEVPIIEKDDKGKEVGVGINVIHQVQTLEPHVFAEHYKRKQRMKVEAQQNLKKAKLNADKFTIGKDYDELLALKSKLMALQKLDQLEKHKNMKETSTKEIEVLNNDIRSFEAAIRDMPGKYKKSTKKEVK